MTATVVLIDSGVNASHPHLEATGELCFMASIDLRGRVEAGAAQTDQLGHGTAAAAAILSLAPGARLHSIKVFWEKPDCPFEHVLRALELAVDQSPAYVNLSLGTPRFKWQPALEEVVERLTQRGSTVVSPASFGGLPSFPGSLSQATGVVADPGLPREAPERRMIGGRAWWYASPYPRDLPGLPRSANLVGPSMAVANVTGHLAAHAATPEHHDR